jgi:hypothetical protein
MENEIAVSEDLDKMGVDLEQNSGEKSRDKDRWDRMMPTNKQGIDNFVNLYKTGDVKLSDIIKNSKAQSYRV